MRMGIVKEGKGGLVGNAGEYFIVGELLRRGITAGLVPRNAPHLDILATNQTKTVRIRAKTKSGTSTAWQWVAKKDGKVFHEVGEEDYTILVDLKEPQSQPDYYIFKTTDLDRIIEEDFKRWLGLPGRKGRPHDPNSTHRALYLTGKYAHYASEILAQKNKWETLGLNP